MAQSASNIDGPYQFLRSALIKDHREEWGLAWQQGGRYGHRATFLFQRAREQWLAMTVEQRRERAERLIAEQAGLKPAASAEGGAFSTAPPAASAPAIPTRVGRSGSRDTTAVASAEGAAASATLAVSGSVGIISSFMFLRGALTKDHRKEWVAEYSQKGRTGHVQTFLQRRAREHWREMTPLERRERGQQILVEKGDHSSRVLLGIASSHDEAGSVAAAASPDRPSLRVRTRFRAQIPTNAACQATVSPGRHWRPRFRIWQKSQQKDPQIATFIALCQHWTVLPADLDHWLRRHSKYEEDFATCKGVLLAVVNLKFGPLRAAFLRAWREAVASTGPNREALTKAFMAVAATVVASDTLSSNGAHDPFYLREWSRQRVDRCTYCFPLAIASQGPSGACLDHVRPPTGPSFLMCWCW